MKVEALRGVVEGLESCPNWQQSLDYTETTRQSRPQKDESNPAWLRAQADMLEAQGQIAPATEVLKLEVATLEGLALPFRIGLLRALDRNVGIQNRGGPKDLLGTFVDTMNMHFPGRSWDLDIKDNAFSSDDPFRHAVNIGSAITEVETALPRLRRTIPAAVLSIGNNRKGTAYVQPTEVDYYSILVPADRQLCEEPKIVSPEEGANPTVYYKLPRLTVILARYDELRHRIVTDNSKHRSIDTIIEIPKVVMLESSDRHVNPTKLLIGRKAMLFAEKHRLDLARERREAQARRENEIRISNMRFR